MIKKTPDRKREPGKWCVFFSKQNYNTEKGKSLKTPIDFEFEILRLPKTSPKKMNNQISAKTKTIEKLIPAEPNG